MILNINNQQRTVDVDPSMPLLWVLRDVLNMTGTKYSCGIGICGTCVVLVDGAPVRSCTAPASSVAGKEIITIEGLSPDGSHRLQKAWIDVSVTQCGYCQPGHIMTAAGLLNSNPSPTDTEIDDAMKDCICRCGTYKRVKEAIKLAAEG